jgi:hypothetical protein
MESTKVENSTNPALNKADVIRRPFDAEIDNGRIMIYTSEWDEFGELKWTANIISPERFKEVVKNYEALTAFL